MTRDCSHDQMRIFERFFRMDPSRSSQSEGSGLEIVIAKSLTEIHKGEIGVRDLPDVNFGLRFPLCQKKELIERLL